MLFYFIFMMKAIHDDDELVPPTVVGTALKTVL